MILHKTERTGIHVLKIQKKHIIIVQRNGIYEITDICPVVSQIKGMGILSVYLRPLRIICDTSDLIQMNAAQKLSEPVTMGYKSKMLVKYPISDHFARLPAKCNMIMIRKYDCKTAYDDLMQVRCEKTDIVIIMFIMKIQFIILKTFSTSRHRRFGNKSAHIVISIICCSSQRTGKHIVLRINLVFCFLVDYLLRLLYNKINTFKRRVLVKKKITSLLIVFVMLITLTSCNESVKQWDGSIADEFGSGDGTESSPYEINDPSQLALLAKQVNEGNVYSGKYFHFYAISIFVISNGLP